MTDVVKRNRAYAVPQLINGNLESSNVQDAYSTALTNYPKWQWNPLFEYFPFRSMEWYRHPEPPTSAAVFPALDIGLPAYIAQVGLSSTLSFLGLYHPVYRHSGALIIQTESIPMDEKPE
ncbi:hypothetical protein GYMLUDRAFT_241013 [Collybiopsis luxurians FD-317 M1]|nr:hypothetical protein GYMLUDRAFT_241013 [Collybiopsis luxurians FD-317 M1]